MTILRIYPVALRAIPATVPTAFFVLCSLFFVLCWVSFVVCCLWLFVVWCVVCCWLSVACPLPPTRDDKQLWRKWPQTTTKEHPKVHQKIINKIIRNLPNIVKNWGSGGSRRLLGEVLGPFWPPGVVHLALHFCCTETAFAVYSKVSNPSLLSPYSGFYI